MRVVGEVGRVLNHTAFQATPDFACHFRLDRATNKKSVRLGLMSGERLINPAQGRARRLPMLVSTCGVDPALEFAQRQVCRRRFEYLDI